MHNKKRKTCRSFFCKFLQDNYGGIQYFYIGILFFVIILFVFFEYNHGVTIYTNVQKEMEQAVSATVLLSIDDEYRKDRTLFISDLEAAKALCRQCIKEDLGLDDLYRRIGSSGVPLYYLTNLRIEVRNGPPYLVCLADLHIPAMLCPSFLSEDAEFVLPMEAAAHAKSLIN